MGESLKCNGLILRQEKCEAHTAARRVELWGGMPLFVGRDTRPGGQTGGDARLLFIM